MGLVNDLYPTQDAVLDAARALAREMRGEPAAHRHGTKEVLRVSEEQGTEHGLRYTALWNASQLATRGISARRFRRSLEKRPPEYKGR